MDYYEKTTHHNVQSHASREKRHIFHLWISLLWRIRARPLPAIEAKDYQLARGELYRKEEDDFMMMIICTIMIRIINMMLTLTLKELLARSLVAMYWEWAILYLWAMNSELWTWQKEWPLGLLTQRSLIDRLRDAQSGNRECQLREKESCSIVWHNTAEWERENSDERLLWIQIKLKQHNHFPSIHHWGPSRESIQNVILASKPVG